MLQSTLAFLSFCSSTQEPGGLGRGDCFGVWGEGGLVEIARCLDFGLPASWPKSPSILCVWILVCRPWPTFVSTLSVWICFCKPHGPHLFGYCVFGFWFAGLMAHICFDTVCFDFGLQAARGPTVPIIHDWTLFSSPLKPQCFANCCFRFRPESLVGPAVWIRFVLMVFQGFVRPITSIIHGWIFFSRPLKTYCCGNCCLNFV